MYASEFLGFRARVSGIGFRVQRLRFGFRARPQRFYGAVGGLSEGESINFGVLRTLDIGVTGFMGFLRGFWGSNFVLGFSFRFSS